VDRKYSHIVFDVDGTLIDSEYSILRGLQMVMEELYGKVYQLDELTFALGVPGKNTMEQLSVTNCEPAMKLWSRYQQELIETVQVFAGMEEVLGAIKEAGFQLGIITSKDKKEYRQEFVPHGIDDYFDVAICMDDTVKHKPDPAPLLKYMEKTGVGADELLYIGDSVYDQQCAWGACVDFVLGGWGCKNPEGIKAMYYPLVPEDILDILGIK